MTSFEKKLEKYAEVAVKIGLNLQEGQNLQIQAHLESADFVRKVTKIAYGQGCKRVSVNWHDPKVGRIHLENAPEETLKEIPQWDLDKFKSLVDNHDCILNITGSDPKAFEGVDPERITISSRAQGEQMEFFGKGQLRGDIHWAIVGVPTAAWAKTVFPEKSDEEALELLWDAVFKSVRADKEDPVAAWKEHTDTLNEKLDYLNSKHFKTLHYSSPVTNLSIDLHPDHVWIGGGHKSTFDTSYIPNLPTEEVFTTPDRKGVSGTVTSTKPLSFMGNMIENFSLTFKDGKVVEFTAEKGYEALQKMLDIDEEMKYLGEVALVPHDSPISNSGLIFNNTLYDENASCHLAVGQAITMSVDIDSDMSKEELKEKGVNQSFGHTDFMIGSSDLDIDAETADGERIPLFRNGNWAI